MQRTITENEQFLALACRNLRQQREQVVRHSLRILTHDTAGMGAGGVEVAQQRGVPLLSLLGVTGLGGVVALGVDDVRDGGLNREFGVPVGVGGTQGALLGDRNHVREASGIAVDGGRAGEDDIGHIVAEHGAQEADGAVDVDIVVIKGFLAGFADGLVRIERSVSVSGYHHTLFIGRGTGKCSPSAQQSG